MTQNACQHLKSSHKNTKRAQLEEEAKKLALALELYIEGS